MTTKKLRFALFGNIYQEKKSAHIQQILGLLQQHGAEIVMERLFYEFLVESGKIRKDSVEVFDEDLFTADFVVSLGGDGTLLRAASHVGDKQIPILGVNMGRLGYLAGITPDNMEEVIETIYQGNYTVEKHSTIVAESGGKPINGCKGALNDIAILKRDTASMITIHVSINGEYMNTYQADGLIVCTPTGSTAYSLSNGGPIIASHTGNLCITPVAAHSLNVRPVVINDSSVIKLSVESRSHNFLIAIDGQSEKCPENMEITIRKNPYYVQIVKVKGQSYFSTLRQKMMWGVDTRK